MQNYYLSADKMNKLKEDLMPKNKKPYTYSSISSSEYDKMKNKEVGLYFEENIRNILMLNYGWKNKQINRKLLYCYIKCDNDSYLITNINETKLTISNKKVTFKINENKSLDIINDNKVIKIKNQEETKTTIVGKEFIITERKDMENDGFFELNNFDTNIFDKNEICEIYKNIKPDDIKKAKQAIIESKLNKNKVNELLLQLKRDKLIYEKVEERQKDSIIYIGFINSKSINKHEFLKNIIPNFKDLKFILFGIKNSIFGKRKVTEFYDWEGIKNVKRIERRIDNFEGRIVKLENEVVKMNKKLDIIIKKLSNKDVDNNDDDSADNENKKADDEEKYIDYEYNDKADNNIANDNVTHNNDNENDNNDNKNADDENEYIDDKNNDDNDNNNNDNNDNNDNNNNNNNNNDNNDNNNNNNNDNNDNDNDNDDNYEAAVKEKKFLKKKRKRDNH